MRSQCHGHPNQRQIGECERIICSKLRGPKRLDPQKKANSCGNDDAVVRIHSCNPPQHRCHAEGNETSLPYASEESIGLQPVCIRIDPRTILVFAEKQLLNPAQELVNFHRRGQETIAVQNAGGDKLAFRNEIAQAKQRNMAKIVI